MNIFVLDENPYKAAQYLCDKHVVKMIIESCQLLASHTYLQLGITNKREYLELLPKLEEMFADFPRRDEYNRPRLYGVGFLYHPCTRWLSESDANVQWLLRHLNGMLTEYERRYNKVHSCNKIYLWFSSLLSGPITTARTEFVLAMPEEYKDEDPVQAYRTFYVHDKSKFCTWKTKTPEWFTQMRGEINGI